MLRWNDKLRPAELWEIDKQGHKMLVAFVLWHENTAQLPFAERLRIGAEIIEGGLFDYFYRLIITDIKPTIFYRIRENTEHYKRLTEHVLMQLEAPVKELGEDFWERLCAYHHTYDDTSLSRQILQAAHQYASNWEFQLIRPLNGFDTEMPRISGTFEEHLQDFKHLNAMPEILDSAHALGSFARFCGQLRFQIRWTQCPRVPATSVLGHMFLVAVFSYFASLCVDACPARRVNNFFCGLLHDLPELLTRDIISPVKRSVEGLSDLIREYEEEELNKRLFIPLEAAGYGGLTERLGYYLGLSTGSEFHDTIIVNGEVQRKASFEELHKHCNADALDPKDGQLIKICDLLAAFMEAHTSIRNGVSSRHLREAVVRLGDALRACPIQQLHLKTLLADFD